MRFLLLFFIFLWNKASIVAQPIRSLQLTLTPFFDANSSTLLDTTFHFNSSDSIRFETCRFYISGIELQHNSKTVWKEKNSFHLVDVAQIKSLMIALSIPKKLKYDSILFHLGIDSNTNTAGVLGGDLDPTKGMYWTWQSGYINAKLEGKSNLVNTPTHAFAFHLGGFLSPFQTLQTISIPYATKDKLTLFINLQQFISAANLTRTNQVMSPNENAVILSKLLVNCFSRK
jgi:hypothetical protein